MLKSMLNHPAGARADAALNALGDATRRAMIHQLSAGPASVTQLAEPLEISRSAVLQHLTVLEESGLVSSRKEGRVRVCRLEPAGLEAAASWLDWHKSRWESRLDNLGRLLDEDANAAKEE